MRLAPLSLWMRATRPDMGSVSSLPSFVISHTERRLPVDDASRKAGCSF